MSRLLLSLCAVGLVLMMVRPGLVNAEEEIPSPPREFRGAWVATVANIDWPSKPGLSTEEQKKEAIAILDRSKELNFNAIVFQVRPQADALYKSELEPWSYYLTGEQGKAPEPFYDPLEFWVKEAHARGLELHTWFNPYRANHPAMKSEISEKSIVKARPELVVKLGDQGYYWMDPALKAVQDHSIAVVMDVVKRYDVDGVHFDDYFYPYPSYNDNKDFPDDESWNAYKKTGGTLSRGDFRRDAVNTFIKRLYDEIKAAKPSVQFGISPFGIWRPGYPESIAGFDQYDQLYADAKLWLNEGWVDYFTPQLYWATSQVPQSYPVLLGWWIGENKKNRHIWPGLYTSKFARENEGIEIINQIMITRGFIPEAPGNIHFSIRPLLAEDCALAQKLVDGAYRRAALVPLSPWLGATPPKAPDVAVKITDDKVVVSWKATEKEAPFLWVVYSEKKDRWGYELVPGDKSSTSLEMGEDKITQVAVSAVDNNGNESDKTVVPVEVSD